MKLLPMQFAIAIHKAIIFNFTLTFLLAATGSTSSTASVLR